MTRNPSVQADCLHVVEPRAAGLDVHKLQVTASTRLCDPGGGEPRGTTREFRTSPAGLAALTAWLLEQGVEAVAMEGPGIYWEPPFAALESAGLRISLLHAQQVKQLRGRKTDLKDSQWLACVCQFGLGTPSYIPPLAFRDLRRMTRNRRKLIGDRSRARNRVQKLLDRNGLQLGGALSDIFGVNGRRVLEGLAKQEPAETILAGLTAHVRPRLKQLAETLTATLDVESLCQLRSHLQACDHASELVAGQDRRIAVAIAPWQHQLDLLETIPGIDRASACSILATAYKLLRTVYAVLREDRHYRDPGIDYEQLQVQRSAPRWLAKLRKFGYLPESKPAA